MEKKLIIPQFHPHISTVRLINESLIRLFREGLITKDEFFQQLQKEREEETKRLEKEKEEETKRLEKEREEETKRLKMKLEAGLGVVFDTPQMAIEFITQKFKCNPRLGNAHSLYYGIQESELEWEGWEVVDREQFKNFWANAKVPIFWEKIKKNNYLF